MRRSTLFLTAATLDWLVGDPEQLPHPVRLIGHAITKGEQVLHPEPDFPDARPHCSKTQEFLAGLLLTTNITIATYLLSSTIQNPILLILLASTTLAARNLDDEARKVLEALDRDDLPVARQRLARIVGRDTATLDQPALCRALIETLAESLSDGIVAPLFYLALGGLPAAMAFKAVSTMDSMIGHRTPRYLYFGRPAARLDDAANYLPARLTAHALLAFAPRAHAIYRRNAHQHASPNAGHPEAAMAGVLGIQLGGPSTYAGEPHQTPFLNYGARLPTPADAHRALVLTRAVALAAALAFAAVVALAERRKP